VVMSIRTKSVILLDATSQFP